VRVRELALGTGPSGLGLKNNKTMQLVEVLNLFGNMDFIVEEWERSLGAIYMLDKAGVMNAHQWFFGRMPHSVMALNL